MPSSNQPASLKTAFAKLKKSLKDFFNPPTIVRITHLPGSSAPLKTPIIKNATKENLELAKQIENSLKPKKTTNLQKKSKKDLISFTRTNPTFAIIASISILIIVALLVFLLLKPSASKNPEQIIDPTLAAKEYASRHPIINHLPIIHAEYSKDYSTYTEFRIDGGDFNSIDNSASPCPTEFCLKITDTTGGNQKAALEKIRALGFNPDDYHILYEHIPIEPLE